MKFRRDLLLTDGRACAPYPRVSRNPTRWSRGTKTLGTRLRSIRKALHVVVRTAASSCELAANVLFTSMKFIADGREEEEELMK